MKRNSNTTEKTEIGCHEKKKKKKKKEKEKRVTFAVSLLKSSVIKVIKELEDRTGCLFQERLGILTFDRKVERGMRLNVNGVDNAKDGEEAGASSEDGSEKCKRKGEKIMKSEPEPILKHHRLGGRL
jgi:hypothetical protein